MADSTNARINVLMAIFLLIAAGIISRMFYWQVVRHSVYIALAEGQRVFLNKLFPERGGIFIGDKDSSGFFDEKKSYFPVALNRYGYTVYAVPVKIKNVSAVSESLAKILGMPVDETGLRLSKPDDYHEIIAKKVSEEKVSEIKALEIDGINFESENWRYWPENGLLAQTLGFVGYSGSERKGQYGIEGYFNDDLLGTAGVIEAERDTAGKWISLGMKQYRPAENGSNVYLTIDRAIQYQTEKALGQAAQELEAEEAQAIVMEPGTGKILAMANWPGYDLNNYSSVGNYNIFLNKNIQSRYEPGSVIKPFTVAVAINEGKITPDMKYEDKGKLVIDGWPITNSEGKVYGWQTMTEVLEKSINTGAVFASDTVNKDIFQNYFKDFGFDTLTGIELQGEISGDLSNLDAKKDIVFANASFGQGIAMTPIEIAAAFSSLINGGRLMKPYIVNKIVKHDGSVDERRPEIVRQIISPETSAKISAMLVSVVEKGHARGAAMPGYWIGGKTGTAQIPFVDKRGYSEKMNHTFIGFGSAPDSKFLIFIKISDPKGAAFAESSTVPVFHKIEEFLVSYLDIPPNRK